MITPDTLLGAFVMLVGLTLVIHGGTIAREVRKARADRQKYRLKERNLEEMIKR